METISELEAVAMPNVLQELAKKVLADDAVDMPASKRKLKSILALTPPTLEELQSKVRKVLRNAEPDVEPEAASTMTSDSQTTICQLQTVVESMLEEKKAEEAGQRSSDSAEKSSWLKALSHCPTLPAGCGRGWGVQFSKHASDEAHLS